MPPDELKFEPVGHVYTLGNKRLPSVTTVLESVLRDMEGIPEHLVAAAGEFGQHVDTACDLFDRAILDWEALDTRLVPYVRGYEKFIKESGAVIIASKKRVYHPKHLYAGEVDKLVVFLGNLRPCVLDIKSSSILPRSVKPQTAAYREALVASNIATGPTRYSVHLRPDGTYRLDRHNNSADFSIFLSALNIWRFKNVY